MLCRERFRKLDAHADDEVAALVWLLALGHAEAGEALCEVGAGRSAAAHGDLLSIDGLDGSVPACEGLLEVELNDMLDIVTFAGKEGMSFLYAISIC